MDLPHRLPDYLNVDRQSEWQTSAVISSAVETVTLPSRLRPYHDFEASLAGSHGTHKILELQSTIAQREQGHNKQAAKEGSSQAETEFDIDFTYDGKYSKTAHIFNQVQITRGDEPGPAVVSAESGDTGHLRKPRLYNSEPMLQRCVLLLLGLTVNVNHLT